MLVPFSAAVSVLQGGGGEGQHSICHSAVSGKDGAVGKSRSLRCPHQSHPCAVVIPSLQRQQSRSFQDEPTLCRPHPGLGLIVFSLLCSTLTFVSLCRLVCRDPRESRPFPCHKLLRSQFKGDNLTLHFQDRHREHLPHEPLLTLMQAEDGRPLVPLS